MLFSSTKQKPREVLVTLSLINLMSFKLSAHTLVTACLTYRKLPEKELFITACCRNFSLHTYKVVVIEFINVLRTNFQPTKSPSKNIGFITWVYSLFACVSATILYAQHCSVVVPSDIPLQRPCRLLHMLYTYIKSLVYHKYVCKGNIQMCKLLRKQSKLTEASVERASKPFKISTANKNIR